MEVPKAALILAEPQFGGSASLVLFEISCLFSDSSWILKEDIKNTEILSHGTGSISLIISFKHLWFITQISNTYVNGIADSTNTLSFSMRTNVISEQAFC